MPSPAEPSASPTKKAKRDSRMIEDFDEEDEPLSRRNSVIRRDSTIRESLAADYKPEDIYSPGSPDLLDPNNPHLSMLPKPSLEACAMSIRSVSPIQRDLPPRTKTPSPLQGFPPSPRGTPIPVPSSIRSTDSSPIPKYIPISPVSDIYSATPVPRSTNATNSPVYHFTSPVSNPPSLRHAPSQDQSLGLTRPLTRHATFVQKKSSLSKQHSAHDDDSSVVESQRGKAVKVDYSGASEKTDPREIALVRKLDWRIMPMIWIMYFLNYIDRNAITMARLNNIERDLRLVGTEYQTCVSILFVGYILGQIPSNMIINRVKPRQFMGVAMMAWAVVSAMTARAENYTGLLLTRFFLGLAEAPFSPGAIYLLSMFYKRKEVATRVAILYTGNIFATAFAGLIAAGVFHGMDGVGGLAGWRWLFILEGGVTFLVAFVGFFLLPDLPLTTWWLNDDERQLAHRRIQDDTADNGVETGTWTGFKQAVTDPMVWLFCMMGHFHLASNGFKNFFPTVVATLGFNTTVTLALIAPPYVVSGLVAVVVSWSSGKFNERTWHITCSKIVAIAGFVAAAATLNTGGRYVALMLFTMGTYGANSLILGWAGSVCGQTKEKKAVALAMVTTWMNISQIWTPYLWPRSDSPRYALALGTSAAFSLIAAVFAWIAKMILVKRNKRLREDGKATVFYVY